MIAPRQLNRVVIATHGGKFHADDVFAVAVLELFFRGRTRVIRTRERAKIERAAFAVDVGDEYDEARNRFDHHQLGGAGERLSGIPYAAFGLVWKKFGEKLCRRADIAAAIDETMATSLDANDNGIDMCSPHFERVFPYQISDAVRAFVPTWQETESDDERFAEAAAFAKRLISREIARTRARLDGETFVKKAYDEALDKRLIVLDGDYPWKDVLSRLPEPLFVILPQEGNWSIYCVRDDPTKFENRKDLPALWAGLRDKEFARASGVADALFCHRNRFMAVARSKEGALALARHALADKLR